MVVYVEAHLKGFGGALLGHAVAHLLEFHISEDLNLVEVGLGSAITELEHVLLEAALLHVIFFVFKIIEFPSY